MTLDSLNALAESTPDSKNTVPGEILFFRQNSSIGESLKKLKNHNFKIGYSFSINVGDKEYTKIIAYNKKNDIFSGWAGFVEQEGQLLEVFPIIGNGFSCYLNMPRIDKTGKLRLYRENMSSLNRQSIYARRMFEGLDNLLEINDVSLYGDFWPVLENQDVENYCRNKKNDDEEFYGDIAFLCNIYKFDETYNLLDDGLKTIYKTLLENREKLFCIEYRNRYEQENLIQNVLNYLEIDEDDVKEMFDVNDLLYMCNRSNYTGKKSSFIKNIKRVLF